MDVNINDQSGKLLVSLGGNFTFMDVADFKPILEALDNPDVTSCEFDMSKLVAIDSSGLGMLVSAHDISSKHQYPVSLTGTQIAVRTVLEVTRMDNLFEIP